MQSCLLPKTLALTSTAKWMTARPVKRTQKISPCENFGYLSRIRKLVRRQTPTSSLFTAYPTLFAVNDLYAAISHCAGLHPSLEDSDDEQALPGIMTSADGEPTFEINMNGFSAANDDEEEAIAPSSSSNSPLQQLSSLFPLTSPIPTPMSHPHLIHPSAINMEEDLLTNTDNLRAWLTYINAIRERIGKSQAPQQGEDDALLGPLASADSRRALQELTMTYERALALFPNSYKLWKLYLMMRQSYVLGPLTESAIKTRKNNEKRGQKVRTDVSEMLAFAEGEYEWQGGLDGLVGFAEWKSLMATGERMIRYLSHVSKEHVDSRPKLIPSSFSFPAHGSCISRHCFTRNAHPSSDAPMPDVHSTVLYDRCHRLCMHVSGDSTCDGPSK